MLKDNLVMLRNMYGYSQEEVAGKINISRQAYAKWESGATVPDIEKCAALAAVYGTTVDGLLKTEREEGIGPIPPAPRGKSIWGTVTVNDRGQIVIPKDARDRYGLAPGQRLIVLGDEAGLALLPAEIFERNMKTFMEMAATPGDREGP